MANVVLPLANFAYQPLSTLSRRLKERLSESVALNLREERALEILDYLSEKKLVGTEARNTGRYKDFGLIKGEANWQAVDRSGAPLSQIDVFQTDIWLADPAIESTIGVPTAENSDEAIELCFQLGLLSKTKCTWTSAGQLIDGLRRRSANSQLNPMRLGLEAIALLRQVVKVDGLLLRELLRFLQNEAGLVNRDKVALELANVAANAYATAQALRLPPPTLSEGKKFVTLLKTTSAKRARASRAPGVLEHRSSPRLEWLTDFGALTKQGRARNSFEYGVTADTRLLLELLDRDAAHPNWPEDVALTYWRRSDHWADVRGQISPIELRGALKTGYQIMQRSVGPTSIRDVCLAAGVLAPGLDLTLDQIGAHLLAWASEAPGITVSGGRYSRTPELVHMTSDVLGGK